MKRQKYRSLTARNNRNGYLFIFPWIIGFLLFFIIPLGQSVWYSFCQVVIGDGLQATFTGLNNYKQIFIYSDSYVKNLKASVGTFLYTLPITVVLSLILAVILNQKFHGRLLARAIFFLPVIIATGVVLDIFNTDVMSEQLRGGSSSYNMSSIDFVGVLNNLNLPRQVTEPLVSNINKVFDLIWQCGVQTILFLAGLQAVPEPLYEVSKVEGATAWEDFWLITLPMISHILLLVIVYTIIDIFTTADNPVMDQAYTFIQTNLNYDQSSAMLWAYFALVGIAVAILMVLVRRFLLKRWDH